MISVDGRFFFLGLVTLLLFGCSGGEPQGGPRFETNAVTGIVHIDGQPADLVEVTCYPATDSASIKYPLSTVTSADGAFSLTTYESGDGLPDGTYTLTFKWMEPALVPKDKLRGAYADPSKSTHKITVVKGQETVIGTIELTTKSAK